MSPVSALLLSCVIAGVLGITPPGIKARITPKGLQFASQRAKTEVLKLARGHSVPDQSGEYNIYIGTVYYRTYRMYITDISIENVFISPRSPYVTVHLGGAKISVHGYWTDEFYGGWFGDSGYLNAVIRGLYLTLYLNIGYDGMGKPTVSTSCRFSVDDVSLTLRGSGKYDWIYERKKSSMEGMIKDKLNAQLRDFERDAIHKCSGNIHLFVAGLVCSELIREVNTKAAQQLRNLKVVRPITKYAEIDLGLISQPEFGTIGSITTSHKGTVYETAHHREPPFNVSVLPYDFDETNMIFFWITDYVANSACYVLHYTRFFQYILTKDNIPAGANLNLNTSGFQMMFLIPQLSKLYPKRLMQINMTTTAPPKMTFGASNVSVVMEANVSAYVVQPDRSLTYVFTLGATVKVSAKLGSYETNVTWDKASISFDVELLKSAISDFKIEDLRKKLKMALKTFIMPKVQQMGKVGIPFPSLPLSGYGLSNLNVSHGQNFLKIGTDIYYPGRLQDKLKFLKEEVNPYVQRLQHYLIKI